jgi:phage host-nuclease inhibitor protein Gam
MTVATEVVPAASDLLSEIPQDLTSWEEAQLVAAASRLLRAVGEFRAEASANKAALAIEIEHLSRRYARLNALLEGSEQRYVEELRRIFEVLPLRGKKSRKLPTGTLQARTVPAKVVVTDVEAVIAAVRENVEPDVAALIVRQVTETKLDHKALTNLIIAHQWAPLPGTEIVPEREEFYARPEAE